MRCLQKGCRILLILISSILLVGPARLKAIASFGTSLLPAAAADHPLRLISVAPSGSP